MKTLMLRLLGEMNREDDKEVVSFELIHADWVMDFTRQDKNKEDILSVEASLIISTETWHVVGGGIVVGGVLGRGVARN